MWLSVVVSFPDPRHAGDTQWTAANDVDGIQIANVRCYPSAIVGLREVIASLMISADEERQEWSSSLPAMLFVEISKLFVLLGHCHAGEIVRVANSLRIVIRNVLAPEAYKEVNQMN